MGYFPYAFGFIGCIMNATLGYLGSFPEYFPKPTFKNFASNLIVTWVIILVIYGGFPIVKENIPAIDTTPVQVAICVGIGTGGVPAFRFIWLVISAFLFKKTGVNPNDCIKKSNGSTNGQTS